MPGPVVFDSAGKYGAGLALENLGKCLNQLEINKEDVLISNKLAWVRTPLLTAEPTFEKGVWFGLENDAVQDISYQGIMNCWEQGNELLGGNYKAQLLSVHDPDEYILAAKDDKDREKRFQDILEAYRALSDLKSSGKIKAIGIGAKNWRIIQELSDSVRLDWVMFANSLTLYSHPTELLDFMSELQKKNITVINSAVFNAGFLVGGKYFDYKLADPEIPEFRKIYEWRKTFFEICKQWEIRPSHACIQFGISHPAIASIALNTSQPENVKINIDEVNTPLPGEFFKALKKAGLINSDYPYL